MAGRIEYNEISRSYEFRRGKKRRLRMADNNVKFGLTDGVKKLLLAGIGAVAVTAEKSQEVLDDLVERGEITVEQGKALNQELKHTIKENVSSKKEDKEPCKEEAGGEEKPDLDAFIKSLSPEDLQKLKDTLNAG